MYRQRNQAARRSGIISHLSWIVKRNFPLRLAAAAALGIALALAFATVRAYSPRPPRLANGYDHGPVDLQDSYSDGTPDFLRLDDDTDQQAFRRWFTFLAEQQYFAPAISKPGEVVDCAALVRYAYREALRSHDENWTAASTLPLVPSLESVRKYNFPHTPLGAALFRVREGPFLPSDLQTGAFSQFANAETLWRFNTFFVSRDVSRALPGDLLFFRQPTGHMPFHTMIFLGKSQISQSDSAYVVYHTGPDAAQRGEMRRLSLGVLLHHPHPQWQPRLSNPSFLGVFRWNILRTSS